MAHAFVLKTAAGADAKHHRQSMAHITGGGITRTCAAYCLQVVADIDSKTGRCQAFQLVAEGATSRREMFRTFNCGIGMVVIVARRMGCGGQAVASGRRNRVRIGVIRPHGDEHQTTSSLISCEKKVVILISVAAAICKRCWKRTACEMSPISNRADASGWICQSAGITTAWCRTAEHADRAGLSIWRC